MPHPRTKFWFSKFQFVAVMVVCTKKHLVCEYHRRILQSQDLPCVASISQSVETFVLNSCVFDQSNRPVALWPQKPDGIQGNRLRNATFYYYFNAVQGIENSYSALQVSIEYSCASWGKCVSCDHLECRSFSSSIHPKQSKTLWLNKHAVLKYLLWQYQCHRRW